MLKIDILAAAHDAVEGAAGHAMFAPVKLNIEAHDRPVRLASGRGGAMPRPV